MYVRIISLVISSLILSSSILAKKKIENIGKESCYPDSGLGTLIISKCYKSVIDEIKKGADVNQLEVGESPLTIAVRYNDIKMVKILVSNGAKVHYECSDYPCYSPYIMALYDGRLEITKIFIENGAPVNLLNKYPFGNFNCSALYRAVKSGNVKLVKYMIKQGADVSGSGGPNPILAIKKLSMLNYFIKHNINLYARFDDSGDTLLHLLATKGVYVWEEKERLKVIKRLVSIDFDINTKDFKGRTPLYTATLDNNIETVKLLVNLGADINLPDERGLTPLAVAKRDKYKELVLYLESIGATE